MVNCGFQWMTYGLSSFLCPRRGNTGQWNFFSPGKAVREGSDCILALLTPIPHVWFHLDYFAIRIYRCDLGVGRSLGCSEVHRKQPLKKRDNRLAHEHDRLRYACDAADCRGNFSIFRASIIEFRMPARQGYIDWTTVDLLWLSNIQQHQFCLFLGSDNRNQLQKSGKNSSRVSRTLRGYSFIQGRVNAQEVLNHPRHAGCINAPLLDISATFIRSLFNEGKSSALIWCPESVVWLISGIRSCISRS